MGLCRQFDREFDFWTFLAKSHSIAALQRRGVADALTVEESSVAAQQISDGEIALSFQIPFDHRVGPTDHVVRIQIELHVARWISANVERLVVMGRKNLAGVGALSAQVFDDNSCHKWPSQDWPHVLLGSILAARASNHLRSFAQPN